MKDKKAIGTKKYVLKRNLKFSLKIKLKIK